MLLTTMIIRTLLCKPQEIDAGEFKARDFDKDLIAKHLSEAVQIPTVSMVGEFTARSRGTRHSDADRRYHGESVF